MSEYCTHIDCRTEAVATLQFMARRLPARGDEFLGAAREVINNPELGVKCQHIPRDKRTPFYEKEAPC